jgi:hypothetical protein
MTFPSWRVWAMLSLTEMMPKRTREKLVATQMGERMKGDKKVE